MNNTYLNIFLYIDLDSRPCRWVCSLWMICQSLLSLNFLRPTHGIQFKRDKLNKSKYALQLFLLSDLKLK